MILNQSSDRHVEKNTLLYINKIKGTLMHNKTGINLAVLLCIKLVKLNCIINYISVFLCNHSLASLVYFTCNEAETEKNPKI